ncbi:hypothetical protein H0H93_001275, partial [Arthromyces matolae]
MSVSSASSPAFAMSSAPVSTAATSPPPMEHDTEETKVDGDSQNDEEADEEMEKRYARLQFVLQKSAAYTSFLQTQMEQHKKAMEASAKPKPATSKSKRGGAAVRKGRKRARVDSDDESEAETSSPK